MSTSLYVTSSCYCCTILTKLEFFRVFRKKKTQISNFIKIRPSVVQLFQLDRRMDGRTDMTKLTVVFRNFTNARKNVVAIKIVWQNVVRDSDVSDFETLKSKEPMAMSTLLAIGRLLLCPDYTDSR